MEGQEGPVLDETVLDPVLLPRQKEASSCCQIDFISQPITYQEFFLLYLQPNRPCLFGGHITSQWRCRREWVSKDGKPNWNALKQLFGKLTVPVADCKRVEFQAQPKCDMMLAEFLDYWQDLYTSEHAPGKPCLYLKDWHFCRACPDYGAYETPVFFQSDWLNEFWDLRYRGADDYRFVYMGPKGSWTPLHADVFHSYSWSANICGRKQWLFFPPGQEEQEDTISINHNWVNCCNVHMMWSFLQAELCRVQQAISDCTDMEDWHGHCQVMLKASSGINYEEFVDFLVCIAERRLHDLQVWDQDGSRHHHHRLDLRTLSSLLSVIMADQHFTLMAAAVQAQVGSLKQTLDKVNP
ncbi:2-oxoglutarate and iron-dependent oxygenase JMJD4-like isoform X2 [Branchiostoma floridae x Branchiostoma belcheri]